MENLKEDLQKLKKHTEKVNTLCCQHIHSSFDYHKDIEAVEQKCEHLVNAADKIAIRLGELDRENKELKNDVWNWEKKYKLLFDTYTEFLNHVNNK